MNRIVGKLVLLAMVLLTLGCNARTGAKAAGAEVEESNNVIINIQDMSSFNELINSNQPVLVDFYADWCAPCRMMAPILKQVASDLEGKVKVLKVDVDKNRETAAKYNIRSIPTLILFQNGEVKWQGVGVLQADQIKSMISSKTN
jgi:thioredoxin 1